MNKFDETFKTIMEEISQKKQKHIPYNIYVFIVYKNCGTEDEQKLFVTKARNLKTAMENWKQARPRRRKYGDPDYRIYQDEVLLYKEGEKLPETAKEAHEAVKTHKYQLIRYGQKYIDKRNQQAMERDMQGDPRTGGYGVKPEQPKLGSLYW